MDSGAAILAFSQSEKIKAAIIGLTQALEVLGQTPEPQRRSGEKVARVLLGFMLRDVHLAGRVAGQEAWREVEKDLDLAMVMMDSGVSYEAPYHLNRALTRVTDIGRKSMSWLKQQGLLP